MNIAETGFIVYAIMFALVSVGIVGYISWWGAGILWVSFMAFWLWLWLKS